MSDTPFDRSCQGDSFAYFRFWLGPRGDPEIRERNMVRGPHEKVHFRISKIFHRFTVYDRFINYIPFDSSRQDATFVVLGFWIWPTEVEKIRLDTLWVLKWQVQFWTKIGYFQTPGKNSVYKIQKWVIHRSIDHFKAIRLHTLDFD